MGFFKRKQEMNQSMLTQLKRIADSLECSTQENKDATNKELVAQLNRIAEIVSKQDSTMEGEELQKLALQLSRIVDVLNSSNTEVSDDIKKEQIIQLDRIAHALELALPKEQQYSDLDKTKAAYALNLCLVSISQIIDYSDQYILEQEYEGILNNLNLEHMPKDDALLDILRQILDTITFFRIQEGEKQFIDQEYQDRMKAAIWSAVPSCGAILACPDPKAMLLTLLTQVGSGYMNYRNEKAKAGREKEKAMWELHKAAIEQFNGLRRELFTTAWKLADTYGFKDEMRLTESQITQYNRILQEENLYRRLARLEGIQGKFKAFPPFWYSMGNTALRLFEQSKGKDVEMYNKARKAYAEYFRINNNESTLLRSDPMFSACALEYVSLMETSEKGDKIYYIGKAKEYAGTHFDVLQLCAMAFLDVGEVEEAAEILKELVCEGYNEGVNAQLLSMLYIKEHISNNKDTTMEYQKLQRIVPKEKLVEWPKDTDLNEQFANFIDSSRESFLEKYATFYSSYYSQKARKFQTSVFADAENRNVREENFVRFTMQLLKEMSVFPGAAISNMQFSALLSEQEKHITEIIDKPKKVSNQIFDDIFKNIFIASAKEISQIPLNTMKSITTNAQALEQAMNGWVLEEKDEKIEEYTLQTLFNLTDEKLDKKCKGDCVKCTENDCSDFAKIRMQILSRKLVKENAKHTQLLLPGSLEFKRYIQEHHLEKAKVVAVINDKTIEDCDLIITETGLRVHYGQSKAIKGLRHALLSTGGIMPVLVGEGVNWLYAHYQDAVPYSNVKTMSHKLTNPKYKNDYVDMDELCQFVEQCKVILKSGVAYQISESIIKPMSVERNEF